MRPLYNALFPALPQPSNLGSLSLNGEEGRYVHPAFQTKSAKYRRGGGGEEILLSNGLY